MFCASRFSQAFSLATFCRREHNLPTPPLASDSLIAFKRHAGCAATVFAGPQTPGGRLRSLGWAASPRRRRLGADALMRSVFAWTLKCRAVASAPLARRIRAGRPFGLVMATGLHPRRFNWAAGRERGPARPTCQKQSLPPDAGRGPPSARLWAFAPVRRSALF